LLEKADKQKMANFQSGVLVQRSAKGKKKGRTEKHGATRLQ
jgi:hypothetical protein